MSTKPHKAMKGSIKQRYIWAGKKQQEIEDMNLLGVLIEELGGVVRIRPTQLLEEYFVRRTEDPTTGEIILESLSDDDLN